MNLGPFLPSPFRTEDTLATVGIPKHWLNAPVPWAATASPSCPPTGMQAPPPSPAFAPTSPAFSAAVIIKQQGAYAFTVGLLIIAACVGCCLLQYRAMKQRRSEMENEPLLSDPRTPNGASRRNDVATIGTPARDFVRLSSLPAAIFQSNENRCRACGNVGECVALRPCGHAVLCRPCSDFVFECPACGQYISGISFHVPSEARNGAENSGDEKRA